MLETISDITLTDEYWDCDCPVDGFEYIKPASLSCCDKCGAFQEDQPSAHLNEVIVAGLPVNSEHGTD